MLVKMKEKQKNTKGITLIALVVTIIILIILAGVSINLVFGQSGIITKAKNAKANLYATRALPLNTHFQRQKIKKNFSE